ncbi:MAG: hypothetical protein BWK78_02210 [Thiotrichaceae bacterium IS1]|nr:MAG: hypothetical protein BWK78_02210 [Thiotrichaceae bacterium IS1]
MIEKQQIYLDRVGQFFAQVNNWIPSEFNRIETTQWVTDNTGKYEVPVLSMSIPQPPTPEIDDGAIADLLPEGTSVLMGEGLIKMKGMFGEEWIMYLLKESVKIRDRFGRERPMFKGIRTDGWYWIEDTHRNRAHLMNREIFLELVTFVSEYEF